MISKTSFLKILQNDRKRKLWIFIIFLVIFIFVNPISLLLKADYLLANSFMSEVQIKESINNQIKFSYFGNIALQIILAIFMGYTNYSYLFKRRKVDLYHSLPISRSKLFIINYINGFFFFLIITIISNILNIIVLCIKGFISQTNLLTVGSSFIFSIVCFLLFYNLTIFAIMLTGQLLVSLAATGTLIFYTYILHQLWIGYLTNCMRSYYLTDIFNKNTPLLLSILSPIYSLMYLCSEEHNKWILILSLFVILTGVFILCIILYKIRPSENTGKALCFSKIEPFLTIMITAPAALCGGIYVKFVSDNISIIWFWFAFISSAVICHCLLEIIYHFDFRSALKHKLHLFISVAIGALIALCLQLDWLGYDNFIPEKDKVEYASICFDSIDCEMCFYDIKMNDEFPKIQQVNKQTYLLENMKLTKIEDVISLAKVAISQYDDENKFMKRYDYSTEIESNSVNNFSIKYHMKSGRDIYREYSADMDSTLQYLSNIYNSKEYKSYAYQIKSLMETDTIKHLEGYSIWGDKVLSINGEQIDDLMNSYYEDLSKLTIETLRTETPILRFQSNNEKSRYNEADLFGYYVYPSFTNTLNKMKQYDVSMEKLDTKIDINRIESICVTKYDKSSDNSYPLQYTYETANPEDLGKIKELGPKLELSSFTYSNNVLRPYEDGYEFEIKYVFNGGMDITNYAVIRKGDIPNFVISDLESMNNDK